MKILVIPEYGTYGGTLSFIKRLLAIHLKNGIETGVLIHKNQQLSDVMTLFQEYGVRVYTGVDRNSLFRNPLLSPAFDILFCWRAYRSFRPDLIVVSNGTPGIMSGVLLYPVPVLFVMHTYPLVKVCFPVRLYLRLTSGLRNRFMTVSRFSAKAMNSFMGIPKDRIEVVYNSFRSTTRKTDAGRPVVLTIGHIVRYKNPECWLNVAQQVVSQRPDVRFVWIGDGDMLEQMRQQIWQKGLEGRIELYGYCNQVERYYADAQLCFQPSILESHGISVVEAMAHGLPCVTSNAGGLPESVIDGETGFTCSPDDVKGFVTRITTLIDDGNLRQKMGSAGRRRAETLFSESVQESAILNLYKIMFKQRASD